MSRGSSIDTSTPVVVLLESTMCSILTQTESPQGGRWESAVRFDPSPYLDDASGQLLADEMIRRIRGACRGPIERNAVLISMPGTIENHSIVKSSSRLGVRQELALAHLIERELGKSCLLFQDVECLAIGEAPTEALGDNASQCFAYVLVDEGVGSKVVINGKIHQGAGVAGTVGRLLIEPNGVFHDRFAARGTLESYVSRPWLSQRLVTSYLEERNKRGGSPAELEDGSLRRALRGAEHADWTGIDYALMKAGLDAKDPLMVDAMTNAANSLAYGLNAIMTVLHPHRIAVGGRMMSELPGMFDATVRRTRALSWPLAWNSTEIVRAAGGRKPQVVGTMRLWARLWPT